MKTITVAGQEYSLAPLKALQVAAFFDAQDSRSGSKVEVITTSLRVIAQSLINAKDPAFAGLKEDEAMAQVNELFAWDDVNAAFGDVLDVTSLKVVPAGEAVAAESISSESTAASSTL